MNLKKLSARVDKKTKEFFSPLGQKWFWYSAIAGAIVGVLAEGIVHVHNQELLCLSEHRAEIKMDQKSFAPFEHCAPFEQNDITDKISLFIWGVKEK